MKIPVTTHYAPRMIQYNGVDAGIWHYTKEVLATGVIVPVGPCADGCPGHTTSKGACEHYRQSLLPKIEITPSCFEDCPEVPPCKVCDKLASHVGDIPGEGFVLAFCQEHATKENYAKLFWVGENFTNE